MCCILFVSCILMQILETDSDYSRLLAAEDITTDSEDEEEEATEKDDEMLTYIVSHHT